MGSIGLRHIQIVRKNYPDIKVMVLRHKYCYESDVEGLGLYACVTDIQQAIDFCPDAAIVANPASKHLSIAKTLAKEGVHLLIEKPISASSQGVQELIDLCHHDKLLLMTAYNLRFLPSLMEFRELLHDGYVGQVLSVRAEVGQYLPSWRELDYRKTVSAQKSLGGGVLLELSHEIDYLSWIFGSVQWISSHVSKQSNLEIDVEDTASIFFGFKKQDGSDLTATLNMDFFRHDTTRYCMAIGDRGTLRWNGVAGDVQFYSMKDQSWSQIFSSKPDRDYTYEREISNFISSIETNISTQTSGEEGLKVMQIIDAIRHSSNTGKIAYL